VGPFRAEQCPFSAGQEQSAPDLYGDSQAQSAGSIPVTRSSTKPQARRARGLFVTPTSGRRTPCVPAWNRVGSGDRQLASDDGGVPPIALPQTSTVRPSEPAP
jgi:hypothetical protein